MSVAGKHYYRFIYLKSEEWRTLRVSKLASVGGKCARCGKEDACNDVHHLNYRNLHDVQLVDLLVLCRSCHELMHEYLDAVKEGEFEKKGKPRAWIQFLTMWGPRPDLTPELRPLIVSMRRRGMMEDASARYTSKPSAAQVKKPKKKKIKNVTDLKPVSTWIGKGRHAKIKALALSKGWSLEEFLFEAVCKLQDKLEREAKRQRIEKFMEGLPRGLAAENGLTSNRN